MSGYQKREDFTSDDAYAKYVRAHLKKGMEVICCKEYEEIKAGDIGRVIQVSLSYYFTKFNLNNWFRREPKHDGVLILIDCLNTEIILIYIVL